MKSRKIKLNTNATTSGGKLYTKKATIYTNRMNHTETAGWLASQIQDFLLSSYTLAVFQQGLHPSQRSKKSAQTLLQRCMLLHHFQLPSPNLLHYNLLYMTFKTMLLLVQGKHTLI